MPRLVCPACQVLWTDFGGDDRCWCCGEPGVVSGRWSLPASGVHVHDSRVRQVPLSGQAVPVD